MSITRRARLGAVEFSVVSSETPQRRNEVTERVVEEGVSVADHIKPLPMVFSISGVATGPDAAQKLRTLTQYWKKGTLLRYVGRNVFTRVVIENLSTEHDARTRDGFSFRVELKEVRIARPETVAFVAPDPASPPASAAAAAGGAATSSQANPVQDKGTQQPQEKQVDDGQRESLLMRAGSAIAGYFN